MTPEESEEFLLKLYENRLLLLLEDIDEGKFYQVQLNPEQFKKVSDAISTVVQDDTEPKEGFEKRSLELTEDWEISNKLFDGLTSYEESPT